MEYVDKNQMLVLRAEDLFGAPGTTMATVWDFLGLPPYDGVDFPAFNAGDYSKVSVSLRSKLRSFYGPRVKRLSKPSG